MDEPEKIWTSAMDKSALSMIIFTSRGEVEWVNNGYKLLRGMDHEQSGPHNSDDPSKFQHQPAATIFDLYHDKASVELIHTCIRERRTVMMTAGINAADGMKKWVRTCISPFEVETGDQIRFLAVETNITDIRQKEEELQRQCERLKEATHTFETANLLLEKQTNEIREQKETIEEERNKSEKLLLNILPFEVAKQLKSKGKAGSRHYKMVTVVFADFKGFTRLSKTLEPKELVNVLDGYFARFDEIIEKYYLEKIKTIGDAYMFAGGLPLSNKSNPVDAVLAGLEIQHYMNTLNDQRVLSKLPAWELRIGVHTGPVVAGVIGRKRLAYDIWGDTVNVASRMEQGGHVGMVNVSGHTYSYIKEFFDCDHRGKIETKNQEKTDMYFVNRIKGKYAADPLGIWPNNLMVNIINKL
jgi:PAS domain S-box-containing protein